MEILLRHEDMPRDLETSVNNIAQGKNDLAANQNDVVRASRSCSKVCQTQTANERRGFAVGLLHLGIGDPRKGVFRYRSNRGTGGMEVCVVRFAPNIHLTPFKPEVLGKVSVSLLRWWCWCHAACTPQQSRCVCGSCRPSTFACSEAFSLSTLPPSS